MTRPPLASPVDLVGFAVSQVLLDGVGAEAGTGPGALQPVLGALADLFGCAAAIALRQDAGKELIVLAAHPGPAAADQDLLAQLSALSAVHGDVAHRGGSVKAALTFGGRPVTVRLAYAAPEAGRCLCAIALLGDPARFATECQATARGIAAIVAAQIRQANDSAELAEQRERLLAAELAAREAAEEAQARLAEQNARLQALDVVKTQFISTMSHELRTPLTSIISFAELILDEKDKLAPDTISSLAVIQRNAGRLMHLVGELLLLSRLEQGVLPLDLEVVSVPELVAEAVSSASAGAAEHDITIDVAVAAGPALRADPLRLQQVLGNLLSNAVKYTGQGGKVRVKAGYDGQRWQIRVADNGMGIPADELGSLFDRFVRASNARTAGLPGTGLGLAVVKAITELHGGTVEVRSVVEHGTAFTIYLPVHP